MLALTLALGLFLPVELGATMAQRPFESVEVHADRTVTFRFKDTGARKVTISIEGRDTASMVKEEGGIWSYTCPPLAPDLYGYSFAADSETRLDIHNPVTKPNLIWPSNMFLIPGNPPEPWEVQNIPHGQVHHVFYHSEVIGDDRDYFVYTPPSYMPTSRTKYPTLYLLHGFSDTANGWTEVGKAHFILDSLIAQGKVKPMIVVMTLGYGVPDFASPKGFGTRDASSDVKNRTLFGRALKEEVIPAVEKDFRASKSRSDRAIAGLSMGGAESLFVGLNSLDIFSYVGAFSSGHLNDSFDHEFPNLSSTRSKKQLKLLWISCGTEDGLMSYSQSLVSWLKGKGIDHEIHEVPGRHAWMVWRRNLADFTQRLFRN